MCFVSFDSLHSPLIRGDLSVLHHISSLFDSDPALQLHYCVKEMASANAIHVNNCELSCSILPVVLDVLDGIKSAFPVSSAMLKSVLLYPANGVCVFLGLLGIGSFLH